MKGSTHLSIGLASATVMANNNIKGVTIFLPFIILGSLLPDIDCNKKSLIKSSKIITLLAVSIVGYLYLHQNNESAQIGIVSTLIVSMIFSMTKHRSISHSLIGLAILTTCISLINITGAAFFTIGYISHLISDSITVSGIPLFLPFSKKKIGLKICKADGVIDMMLRIGSICIIIYSLLKLL